MCEHSSIADELKVRNRLLAQENARIDNQLEELGEIFGLREVSDEVREMVDVFLDEHFKNQVDFSKHSIRSVMYSLLIYLQTEGFLKIKM